MEQIFLTGYQALQLLALGPCVFMVLFLCFAGRHPSQVIVPVLYFLSLSCSFFLPLKDILIFRNPTVGALLMGESLTPALSFLLIIQFITGRLPPLFYWSILAVPLIGGSSIVYAGVIGVGNELCIRTYICSQPDVFKHLYEIFSGALTFLLTLAVHRRLALGAEGTFYERKHKYALVLALIALNLAVLAVNLEQITDSIDSDHAALVITIMRIGFIYLVLTSVFRVFGQVVEIDYTRVPILRPRPVTENDQRLADSIRTLLERDKIYREMDLSRTLLARRLAVTEQRLSHVINRCFAQSFSTLLNQYRVTEAQERLKAETTAVTVIAFEVGFSSIPSFNRVFRHMTGTAPSAWRQKPISG